MAVGGFFFYEVSQPYNRRTSVLYILIFIWLDSKLGDKRFCTEWQQAHCDFNVHLFSAWIEFWFARFVPKYLNCSALPKELIISLYIVSSSCILISRHDHVLSFISIYFYTNLLTSNYKSLWVFVYSMYAFAQYMLISSEWSPIIWTRKLTCIFLTSLQLEAHSSSWRPTRKLRPTIYPSDLYHCILSIFFIQRWSSLPILTSVRLRRQT